MFPAPADGASLIARFVYPTCMSEPSNVASSTGTSTAWLPRIPVATLTKAALPSSSEGNTWATLPTDAPSRSRTVAFSTSWIWPW